MPEGRFLAILDFTAEINFIGGYDKYVYMHLAKHAYRNDFCFVSQQKLAVISSSSLRTVQRCLSKLDKTGLVQVVKEGTFKKYYLTIPPALEALAAKYGLVCPTPYKEAGSAPEACAAPESSGSVNMAARHASISGEGDNLSHINKKEDQNNHSPLPPHQQRPSKSKRARSGGVGSFIQVDLAEIREEFQELQQQYPRHEDLREAFEVFALEHGSLPPISELITAIAYEQANNGKWRRDAGRYVPYLKNWLKFRQFETALQFIEVERGQAERAAQAAALPPVCPEERRPIEPIGDEQPFIEADFQACADLWKPNSTIRAAIRGYWQSLLLLGVRPGVEAAKAARPHCSSMAAWLKAFKQEEFSKAKIAASYTNTGCCDGQVDYVAA